jgi:hypothetical protein
MELMAKGKEAAEKPLVKMTVKELRDIALAIPDLTGVHGMNKQDLLAAIKAHRGIVDEKPKKGAGSVREIKQQIRTLKARKQAMAGDTDRRQADILRRRLSRLKKKTRRIA